MRSRAKALAIRAAEAAASAIALYNQPNNIYREDAFCILIVNAWELILKAKIISQNKNRVDSIFVFERRSGTAKVRSRRVKKKNRSGNAMTIGLSKCLEVVRQYPDGIDPTIKSNIEALIEVRDNSAHFLNYEPALADRVFRIGMASVINFYKVYEKWFGRADHIDFAPLPLAVRPATYVSAATPTKADVKNLVDFLDQKISTSQANSEFAVGIQLQVTFTKESKGSGMGVVITNNPSAPEVRLSDEDFKVKFPLDYRSLRARLKKGLPRIKFNQKFNELMKEVEGDANLCHQRFLDPGRKKHGKKFYSEGALDRVLRNQPRLDLRV